jgi:PAS domain S-box-containing protein
MSSCTNQRAAASAALRLRAEEQLKREGEDVAELTPERVHEIIHDLHVYQIELETQNEQLRITQSELEAAREQYVELYDFAPVGYLTVSQEGVILRANLTSVAMLGVERSKLVTKHFTRFVFREDQDVYYACLRKVFKESGKQSCEVRLQPAGAQVFFARLEALRAVEGDASVCGMTLSDITEQKRAEEALRDSERHRIRYESEEWKRLALEAGELGAWDQDLETGRITCSAHSCSMLGFAAGASPTWEDVLSRIHPDDRRGFSREIEKSGIPEGTRRCEIVFRVILPDSSVHWLRFVARTFFKPSARPRLVRRTGILADITRLKEAQEMLRSRAKQLDGLVRKRTARLEEAVAELEHLSYTLVHDLRAPLRAIAGYAHLVLDQCSSLEPIHRKYLERSNAAVQRMDELIVDALSYNKIVRERFTLAPVDSDGLLRQLIESYPQFQDASQQISVEGPMPVVMGNPALLTQCFSNFLTNALKFVAPHRTPRVRIFAQEHENRVRISVQDNGIGIDPHGQQKIFRMFQRLSRDYEGTGIGLALVKKAAERMNGTVGVESEPGQGSRFWLELEKAPTAGDNPDSGSRTPPTQ